MSRLKSFNVCLHCQYKTSLFDLQSFSLPHSSVLFSHHVSPISFTLNFPTPVKLGNDRVEEEVNDNRGTMAVAANGREPGIDAVAETQ